MVATYKYCDAHSIPYKKCGKLVVATDDREVARLEALFKRALQNHVPDIELLHGEKAIQKIEPHCRGVKAIHSPHTGIILLPDGPCIATMAHYATNITNAANIQGIVN
jgi:L-2-hydroxyglutarate oxidase LhgO